MISSTLVVGASQDGPWAHGGEVGLHHRQPGDVAVAGKRPAGAPLLTQADGTRWSVNDHGRPFAQAASRAGFQGATAYALRHSSIIRALLAGVPARVVAASHDTSVAMLERTYSAYILDHSDAVSRRALLDLAAESQS